MFKLLGTTTLLLLTVSLVVGIYSFQSSSRIAELEKSKEKGKISWYAERAKARGDREIDIPAGLIRYAVPPNLDDALANYNLVLAEPIASKSYATTYSIQTWYKFRIVEELSTPTKVCTTCAKGSEPLPDLLPLNTGEFLANKSGGEAIVDGVKIVSKDTKFPDFETNKQYLLFIAFDSTKTIGMLRMGPWGSFKITPNGKLVKVDEKLKHFVSDEIAQRFENSLDKFRNHLRAVKSKQN